MVNQYHLDVLKHGVEVWNEGRKKNQCTYPDFSGADFNFADLHAANLSYSNRVHTTLIRADLNHIDLSHANLSYTNFSYADLSNADFSYANLSYSDLDSTDLSNTNFNHANLNTANLDSAIAWLTVFGDVDLRLVKGLATMRHVGPSHITTSTLSRSQGSIPEAFLREAGVSDDFIIYMHSLTNRPITYYTCFISYSGKDQAFAEGLYVDLQSKGVRCWFAPEDMKVGNKLRQHIDEAILLQDKLLLLLSEHSIASTWMENEVEAALEKEGRQQREVLFPIQLDDTVMQTSRAWAANVRRRHIGDFTNWIDPQAYQHAFNRLLSDLKKTDERQDQEMKQ